MFEPGADIGVIPPNAEDLAALVAMARAELDQARNARYDEPYYSIETARRFHEAATSYRDLVESGTPTIRDGDRFMRVMALRHAARFGGRAELAAREMAIRYADGGPGTWDSSPDRTPTETFLAALDTLRSGLDRSQWPVRSRAELQQLLIDVLTTADRAGFTLDIGVADLRLARRLAQRPERDSGPEREEMLAAEGQLLAALKGLDTNLAKRVGERLTGFKRWPLAPDVSADWQELRDKYAPKRNRIAWLRRGPARRPESSRRTAPGRQPDAGRRSAR